MTEILFDFNKKLNITQEQLDQIPEAEVIWDSNEYIGTVIDQNGERVTLYRVDDQIMRLKSSQGFED